MAQERVPITEWTSSRPLEEMINQLQKENAERQAKILKWTIAAALFAAGALFVSCLSFLALVGVGDHAG